MLQRTVLVAEDDDGTREALAMFLRDQGHRVREARNGRDALACLQSGESIDVIVLDLEMPIMNGWDLLEARRGLPAIARIPTIILSETPPVDPRSRDLPVTLYCAKPFRFDYLAALIETVLESEGPAEPYQAQRS